MKKILVFLLAIFAMALFSVPAFAAGSLTMGSSPNDTSVRLSANVEAQYNKTSTGASYSAYTYNSKGKGRVYGTASDTTYITYKSVAAGSSLSAFSLGTTGDSTDVTSGTWQTIGG